MKINIIGPCGAGKSTLGRQISSERDVRLFELDGYFLDYDNISRMDVTHVSLRRAYKKLFSELDLAESWVAEGIFPIRKVMQRSELIILLVPSFGRAIYHQWKRYCNDEEQRKKFGFVNNLILSGIIYLQYFSKKEYFVVGDFKYPTLKLFRRMTSQYRKKTIEVKSVDKLNIAKYFKIAKAEVQ